MKSQGYNPHVVEAVAVPFEGQNAQNATVAVSINEGGARELLCLHQWPVGLQDTLISNLKRIPFRFFICDDSGSMSSNDGKKLVEYGGKHKVVPCTRWSELSTALEFHMSLARAASAPSEFRMLNSSEPLLIGSGLNDEAAYTTLETIFKEGPRGGTPLCRHIREVIEKVKAMEHQLRSNRQLACVIIATDGESSDGDVAQAMTPLKNLPVWVVIRLCTDDDKVVDYWNNIDSQLELDMDVLDDFGGEAAEVKSANSWITYGLPLHRMREFGIVEKEFDLLDEALLSVEQMKRVGRLIYGAAFDSLPPPEMDIADFCSALHKANKSGGYPQTFCPLTKNLQPWFQPDRINKAYNKNKGCTVS